MALDPILVPEFLVDFDPPCAETYPDAYFTEDTEDANGKIVGSAYKHERDAKTVCISCDARLACLKYALDNNEIGIWGGTTEGERKKIKRQKLDIRTYKVTYRHGLKSPKK